MTQSLVSPRHGNLIDLRPEIPDIDKLTNEARKALGLSSDSGKPLIARYVARKITSQYPPLVPPSLKAIIEKAIAVTWRKSCLHQSDSSSVPTNTRGTEEVA
jgi:hypothetical protein